MDHLLFSSVTVLCLMLHFGGASFSEVQELGFLEEPSSVLTAEGSNEPVTFRCSAKPKNVETYWIHGGHPVTEDTPGVTKLTKHRLSVRITSHTNGSLHHLDNSYQCAARLGDSIMLSSPATAIIATLSHFDQQQKDIHVSVTEGNVAVVPCQLPPSVPTAVSEFLYNGSKIDKSTDRYHLMPSGDLHIASSRVWDSGVYECIAHNPFLQKRVSAPYKVYLTVHVPAAEEQPSFRSVPVKSISVVTGSNVTLECAANGNPTPSIVWHKEGGHLPKRRCSLMLGNLEIVGVHPKDGGLYLCRASNYLGPIVGKTELVVLEPPHIVSPLESHVVNHGREITLDCIVRGNPSPSVKWIHNGRKVHHTSHIAVHDTAITIKKVTKHNGGIYQCFASNSLRTIYSTSRIVVLAGNDTRPPSKSVYSDDNEEENEPDSINGASEGSGKRKGGHGRRKKVKGVKLVPPSRPEITRLSDDSVMVHWSVPQNDGLPISFFKVQYRDVSNPHSKWMTVDTDVPPHINSYAVTGLKAGAKYKFHIAAVYTNNDNKNGPNSIRFTLHKDPPKKRPIHGPKMQRVKAESPSAITLYWEYTDVDSIEIDGFYIYYRLTESAGDYLKVAVSGANTRSHTVSHLLPDTSYDIKMQCYNVAGASEFSNIWTKKTLPSPHVVEKKTSEKRTVVQTEDTEDGNDFYIAIGVGLGVALLVLGVLVALCMLRHKQQQRRHVQSLSDHNSNLQQNGHVANGDYFTAQSRIDITLNPLDSVELSELPKEKYAAIIVTQLSNGHRVNSRDINSDGAIVKAENV
uniref:Putative cell adhesion molecule n=1 Tax=Ornithodoros turicata TaxID=34597 RepID=A0A2R5LG77_9ACAR